MSVPRRIGPYEVVRVLDTGGMGKVYLAKEAEGPAAGRLLVVKTMRAEYERAPEHVASFCREARLLSRLRHPNIVQLFDAGRVGQRLYMAMEYLEGLDLAKVLKLLAANERKIPLAVVAHIGTEVALALDAAHAYESEPGKRAGLVHRDLSPHNIFLLWSGGVKLLDFGLARAYGETSTTRTGMVKGKFRYLAPEQARGEPLDHRVDIFTLGLVLHEMVTGRRAYEQQGDVDVLRAAMNGDFKRLSELDLDVPAALERVIGKATEKERDARHPTAIALAEDLRAAALEASLRADPLTLRSFMTEVRELAEADPPPMHAELDEEDPEDVDGRPSASYFRDVSPIEDRRPPAPPVARTIVQRPSRAWLALVAGAAVVAALLLVVALRKTKPAVASPTSAVRPTSEAAPSPSDAPAEPPSASASSPSPAASAAPASLPRTPAAAKPALLPPRSSGGHRIVRPKRGVGTGVVADYPLSRSFGASVVRSEPRKEASCDGSRRW